MAYFSEEITSNISNSILQVPTNQPAAQASASTPPFAGPGSGTAPSHLPGVIKARERDLAFSLCDEVHALPTIENENITTGALVFAGAGTQRIVACGRAQVFEIDIQPTASGGFQLFEGGNGVQPISGHWTLVVNQFWIWGGKIVFGDVFITVDQACTVNFEARWRQL